MKRCAFRPLFLAAFAIGLAFCAGNSAALGQQNSPDDRRVVIVYSHGTTRPHKVENCDLPYNRVPPSLTRLEDAKLAKIVFVCSAAADGGSQGSYIYKRATEIGKAVDALRATGINPRDIFLAGHSAGAWASLIFMRNHANKVNAAIMFAPACCGPRSEIDQYPDWLRRIQPAQSAEIVSGRPINAVVFAYADDRFNRPEDLAFLTRAFPQSVKIISSSCGAGHLTHLSDCRLDSTSAAIKAYIADRWNLAARR